MKQKLLEILIDEKGKVFISSETNPLEHINPDNLSDSRLLTNLVDSMTEALLCEHISGSNIGRIIKALTMADISADIQPYECAEHLWFTMMNTFLPRNEKRYRKMKEARGFYVEVNEPVRLFEEPSDYTLS